MASIVQNHQQQQVLPEDPLLTASKNEAATQVGLIFDGLDAQVETYVTTANKCAQLFTTSRPHKHAMEWIAFLNKIESLQLAWQVTTADDVDARVKEITILGHHREHVKKEMAEELDPVIESLTAASAELGSICKLSKEALIALKKCNYGDISGLKGKYLTVITSQIHLDKIRAKLNGLPLRLENSYQVLKGQLNLQLFNLDGVGLSSDRLSIKSHPTVDRLRDALLVKEQQIYDQNPFRASEDDQKE